MDEEDAQRCCAVRKIAETARVTFEGMLGLRSKAFTLNSGKREAANFYVLNSEYAAKAFFTEELVERVAGLYGVSSSELAGLEPWSGCLPREIDWRRSLSAAMV
jgi:hypothetical protein